jgi:hypothetical protein
LECKSKEFFRLRQDILFAYNPALSIWLGARQIPFFWHHVFSLQNLSSTNLEIKVSDQCVVDGNKIEGEGCWSFLKIDAAWRDLKDRRLKFAPGERRQFRVSAKESVKVFALFKPLLDPVFVESTNSEGSLSSKGVGKQAGLEFGYQPGYLFLKPQEGLPTRVDVESFGIVESEGTSFARFVFKLTDLPSPTFFNVSAKINENGKLLRFVPLAKEKIFDPDRKTLVLEAQVGKKPEKKSKFCYELFFQNQVSLQNGKSQGCETQEPNNPK